MPVMRHMYYNRSQPPSSYSKSQAGRIVASNTISQCESYVIILLRKKSCQVSLNIQKLSNDNETIKEILTLSLNLELIIVDYNFSIIRIHLLLEYYDQVMQKSTKIGDFQIISSLGEGSFSHVFKVKHIASSEIFALKKIKTHGLTTRDKENALNQIRILASSPGQNIIGYKDSFYDENTKCLYIVIEFAQQGDLASKIQYAKKSNKNIEQAQIWKALIQITQGLKTLHVKKIIHRDLKPANIFIMKDGTYKIGDLNISKVLKNGLAKTQTGTPYYTSPEIWNSRSYGNKVDIWSLGCVLYEMATKRPPFLGNTVEELRRKICMGAFPKIPSVYSAQLTSIINSMIRQNPSYRPSVNQILRNPEIKNHYEGQLQEIEEGKLELIKTIRLNEGNWKKVSLPKSKYQDSERRKIQQVKLVRSQSKEEGITSKSSRVSIHQIYKQKNQQNSEHRQAQKINELREIKNSQKQRQRILSACGPERVNKYLKQSLFPPKQKKTQVNKLPPRPIFQKQNDNNISMKRDRSCSKENLQNAGNYQHKNMDAINTRKN